MKRVVAGAAMVAAAAVFAPSAGATSIGINFVGGGGGAATGASVPAGATAGVVPQANWNNESGATQTMPQPLTLQDGTDSGATVAWSSNNTWSTGAVPTSPTPDQLLNVGYLDDSPTGKPITVTVSNVPTSISGGAYDAILYIAGDTANRGGTVAVNGNTLPGAYVDSGPYKSSVGYVEATQGADSTHGGVPGNFIHLTGLIGSSFSVTLTPTIGSTMRIPLDAVQLTTPVSIPEPATLALLGLGAVGLLPRRRRS